MFKYFLILVLFFCSILNLNGQGFNLLSRGIQIFNFKDSQERNQATFFSEARYENITGLTNSILGEASLDLKDIKSTLRGEISIQTASIKTGIEKRDEHL